MTENQRSIDLLKSSISGIAELKTELVEIENLSVRYMCVTDTDALLDDLIAKGASHEDVKDERIPYWADLWPSALALAQFIVHDEQIGTGIKVLELGCGLAIPGIVAGMKGAAVCLTDYLAEALQVAELNWRLNLPEIKPDCRLMDWRKPEPSLKPDIILASDVAYEKRAFRPLMNAFRKLLLPGRRILLSEPGRPIAEPFLQLLHKEGYKIQDFVFDIQFQNRQLRPKVYDIRLPN